MSDNDDELRIRYRVPKDEPSPYQREYMDDVKVSLDELTQIDTVVRDYVSNSPEPKFEFLDDRRKVEVTAGSAELPHIKLARVLKSEQLVQLKIEGSTNEYNSFTVRLSSGGRLWIDYYASDEAAVSAVAAIKAILKHSHKKFGRGGLYRLSKGLIWLPAVVIIGFLYGLAIGITPGWLSYALIPIQLTIFVCTILLQNYIHRPTLQNRTQQELDERRRVPWYNWVGLLIALASVTVAVIALATRK